VHFLKIAHNTVVAFERLSSMIKGDKTPALTNAMSSKILTTNLVVKPQAEPEEKPL
jgi:hypothetical protein